MNKAGENLNAMKKMNQNNLPLLFDERINSVGVFAVFDLNIGKLHFDAKIVFEKATSNLSNKNLFGIVNFRPKCCSCCFLDKGILLLK